MMDVTIFEWKHTEGYRDKIYLSLEFANFEQALKFSEMLTKYIKDELHETQSSSSASSTR